MFDSSICWTIRSAGSRCTLIAALAMVLAGCAAGGHLAQNSTPPLPADENAALTLACGSIGQSRRAIEACKAQHLQALPMVPRPQLGQPPPAAPSGLTLDQPPPAAASTAPALARVFTPPAYGCAENGSCYEDVSSYTGRAKT